MLLAAFVAILSGTAHADAGVPMILMFEPPLIVLLIPVILIEGRVLRKQLGIPASRGRGVALASNLASTLAGVPLTWGLLVLLQIAFGYDDGGTGTASRFLFGAGWIAGEGQSTWYFMAVMAYLWVLFFLASWGIEYMVSQPMLTDFPRGQVNRAVLRGNVYSYLMLAAAIAIWLIGMRVASYMEYGEW